MPKKKEKIDLRFWVRLDNQKNLGLAIIKWASRAGLDYPAEFIKMVLKKYAYTVALSLDLTDEEDVKNFDQRSE